MLDKPHTLPLDIEDETTTSSTPSPGALRTRKWRKNKTSPETSQTSHEIGEAVTQNPVTPQAVDDDDEADFFWSNDNPSILIRQQREIAVYLNPYKQIVIREQCWPDDDIWIVVSPHHIPDLIDALKTLYEEAI